MTERLVHLSAGFPVGSPVFPIRGPRHGVVEVIDIDPVGHEPRPPVMGRDLDPVGGLLGAHEMTAPLPIAFSRLDPRSRSNTSAQFRPGSPETEPPGCVQAPFW